MSTDLSKVATAETVSVWRKFILFMLIGKAGSEERMDEDRAEMEDSTRVKYGIVGWIARRRVIS